MTVDIPDVLADPVGAAAGLIIAVEPGLGRAAAEEAVTSVAAGRAKRRKLAHALTQRPLVLTDGRSPAPRVVGDLLIALRKAGATVISAPACAGCGKHLRTMQRRGQDWYCSACGPQREACASCGKSRPVNLRGRDGRPRCGKCPPVDTGDPVDIIVDVVTAIDPALPADAVITAINASVSQAGQRHQLAWALQDQPELLTGAGARAPVPSVLRLIGTLCDAGATRIIRPPCPHCGRVIALVKPRDGVRLCRNCIAKSRAEACSRCGATREPATRDEHGRPLCPHCLITDPANQEICAGCGRPRPVSTRSADGPLCPACTPVKTMTCSICGRHAPCYVSKTTGEPWCEACKQRWARCSRCGQVAQVRSGTKNQPLCATCTRPDPGFWRSCPGCGQQDRIHAGRCMRCRLQQRLRDLLSDDSETIQPGLQALYDNLAGYERPATVMGWLDKSTAPAILRELGTSHRPLTHAALDELPDAKPLRHLRAVLVATGALPPRDEQMARLDRWVAWAIAERPDPGQQKLLHRYAVWHVIRRLRGRLDGAHATHGQTAAAQQNIKAAIALLDWLTARDLTLATARQGDLEAWLSSTQAARTDAGNFVRWAKKHKLTQLDFAAVRWGGPTGVIDTETRWEQARRLLHDNSLKPEDRVAGLLVLLYAQYPATLSRLTLGHAETADGEVRIRLGREPILLPAPLDALVLKLIATRHGHAAIGDQRTSPWLFPGGQPGQPISAFQLAERLRQIGIYAGQSRSAALFQLATDLPAAVLARMLGIHISVAVAWQRASAGDWAAYAAEVSRRSAREERTSQLNAPVEIAGYDPRWPGIFATLRDQIAGVLGPLAQQIEHVGSTAVPGLAAKPIIDIDVVIATRADLPAAISQLATLGYRHEADLGITGREAFTSPAAAPAHHLYVSAAGSPELARHLAFRDYLRTHPGQARAYAKLKRSLATRFRSDRDAYSHGKTTFIEQALATTAAGPPPGHTDPPERTGGTGG
jgi:GrpB-like predicted nucleotidyltransferase (UPF0157 family)